MKISNKKQYCQEKFWLVYYTLCLSLISQTKLFSCPQYAHLPLGNHQAQDGGERGIRTLDPVLSGILA